MRVARNLIILSALVALIAVPVSAQDFEPLPTEPPALFPKARISANTNRYDGREINGLINRATRSAADFVNGRKARLLSIAPERTVSRAANDWALEGWDAVVISGGFAPDTILYARNNANTSFLDIGQNVPCVTTDGIPDPSGTCAGGPSTLPFNYMAVSFAEDESGYLAGIIAAAAAHNGRIGIIGGTTRCETCNRYMQGFELGARWLRPEVEITKAFLADDDAVIGFTDEETARAYAETFIDVHQPDVLLPAARANNLVIHDAACDAGVRIVGTDIDLAARYPELAECVLTSATKPLEEAVKDAIFDFTSERMQPVKRYDLANDGVAITSEWTQVQNLPVDLPTRLQTARDEILAGTAVTCPDFCGKPKVVEPAPVADDEPDEGEGEVSTDQG